jgi:hypothetical protein
MYAYFCLTAEYTVKDGEKIDEAKESDCLYDVSIDAKIDFDYSAARKVKVGRLGDILDDTFEWNTYYEDILRLSREHPNVLFDLYYEDTEEFASAHIYFIAGLYQYSPAIVKYEEFDSNKLCSY